MVVANKHVILEPNQISFKDLFKFLFQKDTKKWKFVRINSIGRGTVGGAGSPNKKLQDHVDDGYEYSYEDRKIIFVCIFIQKLLLFVSAPLSWAGCKLEMWFNICSHNGNLFGVFRNLFRGKLVVPQTNSDTFLSFLGCLDNRMSLHQHIKHGDPKFYSSLAIMASKLSYENRAFVQKTVTKDWNMEFMGFFDFWNDYQEKATTQAFIFRNKNVEPEVTVVAFRGTESFDSDAWCTDFDLSCFGLHKIMRKGKGKVHCGFMKALGLVKKHERWPAQNINELQDRKDNHRQLAYYEIRNILKRVFSENREGRFIVTGHSLGGALAALFPAILHHHEETTLLDQMEGVYTFGQPRVGDAKFGKFMTGVLNKHAIAYYRFVYGNDIVPRLPYDNETLMFKHFGPDCIIFDEMYMGKNVPHEPNKNYFSMKWAWKKIVVASKELKRSFNIHKEKGDDYKEGWMMRFVRMLGIIFPGFSAHSLRDYDNSIRFSSDDAFLHVRNSVSNDKHETS